MKTRYFFLNTGSRFSETMRSRKISSRMFQRKYLKIERRNWIKRMSLWYIWNFSSTEHEKDQYIEITKQNKTKKIFTWLIKTLHPINNFEKRDKNALTSTKEINVNLIKASSYNSIDQKAKRHSENSANCRGIHTETFWREKAA